MKKFKVGDVVKLNKNYQGLPSGSIGTIKHIRSDRSTQDIGLEVTFINNESHDYPFREPRLHSLDGLLKEDKGWWILNSYIEIHSDTNHLLEDILNG